MAKLTIVVEADRGDQISNLLEMALTELKKESRLNSIDYSQSMIGHQIGTIGTYTVEYEIQKEDPNAWAKDFDPNDPFGFTKLDKPQELKVVRSYTHPQNWFLGTTLLINDPARPTLKEGQLYDYLQEIGGRNYYLVVTTQGVATIDREHLNLKQIPAESIL